MRYLQQLNVNTVRLWAQLPDATLLDSLAAAGIYAIMAFQVPSSVESPGIDYTDLQPDGYSNEEWYGIMAVEREEASIDTLQPREIFDALRQAFADLPAPGDTDSDGPVDFNDPGQGLWR